MNNFLRSAKTHAKEHFMTVDHPLKQHIVETENFPDPGVTFREICEVLLAEHFNEAIDAMQDLYTKEELDDIDAFAGLDARGFILAGALARGLDKNFIAVRKAGKFPEPCLEESYKLEYGNGATFQIKAAEGSKKGKIAIIDDVLATGGSLTAAANLCTRAGYEVTHMAVLIDIAKAHDDDFNWQGITPRAVMTYE